ncbi:hypothetical protein FPSE_10197 [Fusarium pseudograminearum CS3096]|uniref:Uncharacterized protein n=1 Tax=Fusarium pseudograminearum (strain CS3096) TaxID=1028729 RepID=K3VXX5_FUSPC|nr:hypothetical protein FPSE_10197 [Fusarium pseudograminearum CS3096]EKJ69660.1 hypothetical protein FPSE_10197 [Fusarium pseudograminearum CS3096]
MATRLFILFKRIILLKYIKVKENYSINIINYLALIILLSLKASIYLKKIKITSTIAFKKIVKILYLIGGIFFIIYKA